MIRVLVTGGSGFIGTNLMDMLLEGNINSINIDINAPKKISQSDCWQKCDILSEPDLMLDIFNRFQPVYVIHLAARADTLSDKLDDYKVNTEGTANVLRCVAATPSVQRVIITSSQFVFGSPGFPQGDEDYRPIGVYGKSKMISEQLTRSAGLRCAWTIVRPTNIWGPWHPRYPREFWLVLKRGLYIHPGRKPVIRSYGYVGNVVHQLMKILEAPLPLVDGKVYYLGDPPIQLIDWANGFSKAITGKPVRILPRWLLKSLAAVGTILELIGIRFPIQLTRYRSMTEDYPSPMEPTLANFGLPVYSLDDGIKITVDWLNDYWNGHFS